MERRAFAETRSVVNRIAKDCKAYTLGQAIEAIESLCKTATLQLNALAAIDHAGPERVYSSAMQPRSAVSHGTIDRHIVALCHQLRLRRPADPAQPSDRVVSIDTRRPLSELPPFETVRLPAMHFVPDPAHKFSKILVLTFDEAPPADGICVTTEADLLAAFESSAISVSNIAVHVFCNEHTANAFAGGAAACDDVEYTKIVDPTTGLAYLAFFFRENDIQVQIFDERELG